MYRTVSLMKVRVYSAHLNAPVDIQAPVSNHRVLTMVFGKVALIGLK